MNAYTIAIYPNGLSKAGVELVFNSQDDKTEYVKKEAVYCRKDQSAYVAELYDQKERERKKERFHKCRVEFARKSGFTASSNKTRWERKPGTVGGTGPITAA